MPFEPAPIRAIEPHDVSAAVALVRDVLGEFGLEFGKGAHTDAELTTLPGSYRARGGEFWVAARDGEIIGTCGVFPVAPATFELRKMYLRPATRGLGVGRALLDTAVEWVRAQGGERMVLDTTEQMVRAIAFYEAHGFVRDDTQVRGTRCSRGYTRVL